MTQRLYVNSSEFVPTKGLALIKAVQLKKEETSSSGIIISIRKESVIERPTAGEVISVGDECKNTEVGKIVFWDMISGLDLEFDDGEFILIRDETVVGTKKWYSLNQLPDNYHLLSYDSLILEAIINPGEIKIDSKDINYLNNSFEKLKIAFREGPLLRGYNAGTEIIIVISKNDKLEEIEAMIGHEIIHREQMKYMIQTINLVNRINELATNTHDIKYQKERDKLYNFFTNGSVYELMAYAYQLVKDRQNYKLNNIADIVDFYSKILGYDAPKKFIKYVRMYWIIRDKI